MLGLVVGLSGGPSLGVVSPLVAPCGLFASLGWALVLAVSFFGVSFAAWLGFLFGVLPFTACLGRVSRSGVLPSFVLGFRCASSRLTLFWGSWFSAVSVLQAVSCFAFGDVHTCQLFALVMLKKKEKRNLKTTNSVSHFRRATYSMLHD